MSSTYLLVQDGRDDHSWGDRSTSLALAQQLAPMGRRVSVGRAWATSPIPTGPAIGALRASRNGKRVARRLVRRPLARRALERIGIRDDYVSLEPDKAAERFMSASRRDGDLSWLRHQFEACDRIVVNVLGSGVFRDPPRRDLNFLLLAVELGRRFGKPTFFVNALASESYLSGAAPEVEDAVAATLQDDIPTLARDPVSQQRLVRCGVTQARYVPDALFTWAQRYGDVAQDPTRLIRPESYDCWPESHDVFQRAGFPTDYVAVSGAERHPYESIAHWKTFFNELLASLERQLGLAVVVVDPGGDGLLEEVADRAGALFVRPQVNIMAGFHLLSNARALISGRFHPSILASLGGTPCTFLRSSGHKNLSLQQQLGYAQPRMFPFDAATENVAAITANVAAHLAEGELLRSRIRDVSAALGVETTRGLRALCDERGGGGV